MVSVTSKCPVAVLPLESEAEQFTCVVPRGNVDPDEGEQAMATLPSTLSFADALYVTACPDGLVVKTLKLRGSESDGAVESTTSTGKLPVEPSEPEQKTVVVPI
jgi:hypothetical protein